MFIRGKTSIHTSVSGSNSSQPRWDPWAARVSERAHAAATSAPAPEEFTSQHTAHPDVVPETPENAKVNNTIVSRREMKVWADVYVLPAYLHGHARIHGTRGLCSQRSLGPRG